MFYDKKIKYLNFVVNGERIRGCGFVKVENRDGNINLEMAVSGLPPVLRAYTDVCLCTSETTYPLGQICLENGGGSFRLCNCNVEEINPTGVTYNDWRGIAILPDDDCEISAYWGEVQKCELERVEVSKELADGIGWEPQMAECSVMDNKQEEPVVQEEAVKESAVESKNVLMETAEQERQESRAIQKNREQQSRMAENKWEQISGIYPHIRPFRDKREYLSIRPADFVLLSEESYKGVNNSFLLHGYHNYQHLILARSLKKGKMSYYVGVPGNFFEREKQVAVMFGFTGFECARDPAREGDFGYYLIEVQL